MSNGMRDTPVFTVHIDGAARGNPGPAAFAYVIAREGIPAVEDKGPIGHMTNNQAEYTALVRALERAAALGAKRLVVNSDSELLVKQMRGEYRVKNEDLRALSEEAKRLIGRFEQVTIRHIPRAQNARADLLCNEALDGDRGAISVERKPGRRRAPDAAVREAALACLRAAAARWAKGDPRDPTPEQVWEQLAAIVSGRRPMP